MGASHAATAATVAAGVLPVMPIDDPVQQVAFVAVTAGMGLLPDLDHHSSTATIMWGPFSKGLSKLLVFLGRCHRGGTHDILVAPIVFGLLAYLAQMHPWSTAFVVQLALGLTLRALHRFIPGNAERKWWFNLPVSALIGLFVAVVQGLTVSWLPYSVAIGVAVHIAGDAATEGGVPIPFTWIRGKPHRTPGGPLTTNGAVDNATAVLASIACVALLIAHVPPLHAAAQPVVDPVFTAASGLVSEAGTALADLFTNAPQRRA